MKDLLILVADKDMEVALRGLFSRTQSLGLRSIEFDILLHPNHDPGCLCEPDLVIAGQQMRYHYALVILDLDGCGQEQKGRAALEHQIEEHLATTWKERIAAVVIEPELETWVWSSSPHVDRVLGWSNRKPNLRDWLAANGHTPDAQSKPADPKEAFLAALRHVGRARSASLFGELAQSVSLERCSDSAFEKLKTVLRKWFGGPPETAGE